MLMIAWVTSIWIIAGLALVPLPWTDPFLQRTFRMPVMPSGRMATLSMWIILAIAIAPIGWALYLWRRVPLLLESLKQDMVF